MAEKGILTAQEAAEEAAEIADLKESPVPFGAYMKNGILVDCNGQRIQQTGVKVASTHHAVGSSPAAPDEETVDYASMTKEQLLKLPETAEIDGAKNMSQADIVKALESLKES